MCFPRQKALTSFGTYRGVVVVPVALFARVQQTNPQRLDCRAPNCPETARFGRLYRTVRLVRDAGHQANRRNTLLWSLVDTACPPPGADQQTNHPHTLM